MSIRDIKSTSLEQPNGHPESSWVPAVMGTQHLQWQAIPPMVSLNP